MKPLTRRGALLALAGLALTPAAAMAAPTRYLLDRDASNIGFRFVLNGAEQTGTMPVRQADIVVDPANLAATRVDVTVSVTGARTRLPFATRALTGPDVLDAARFPTIRFVSDKVRLAQDGRLSGGAQISGRLTMRGVTRPMILAAELYRERGSAPDDLSNLTVLLSGQVSRSDFGATGFSTLVEDGIGLDITAVIRAAT